MSLQDLTSAQRRQLARLFILRRVPHCFVEGIDLVATILADVEEARQRFPTFEFSDFYDGKPVGLGGAIAGMSSYEGLLEQQIKEGAIFYRRTTSADAYERYADSATLVALNDYPVSAKDLLGALARE